LRRLDWEKRTLRDGNVSTEPGQVQELIEQLDSSFQIYLDEWDRAMDNKLRTVDRLRGIMDEEERGPDTPSQDVQEPEQLGKPLVEQISEAENSIRLQYIPLLDAVRQGVEEEFRTILRIY
jgi:hypothetical protein